MKIETIISKGFENFSPEPNASLWERASLGLILGKLFALAVDKLFKMCYYKDTFEH